MVDDQYFEGALAESKRKPAPSTAAKIASGSLRIATAIDSVFGRLLCMINEDKFDRPFR